MDIFLDILLKPPQPLMGLFSCFVSDCSIGISYCLDHSPVHLNLLFNEAPSHPRSFKFLPDLCYSDQFKFELANNLELVKKDNASADPNTKWELIKSTVRSTTIRFKSLQSKICKDLAENYEKKIAKLTFEKDTEESPLLQFDFQRKINELNAGLDLLFEEGKAMKYAANLARWYSESNKGSKYFLNKFRQNRDRPIISQLIMDKGTVTENTDILKEAHAFYSNLYTATPIILPQEHLDEMPTLSDFQTQVMNEEISEQELLNALKMKPSSSPGLDGLTVKFYIHFWDLIEEDLVKSYKYSFEQGRLSPSQRQGLIKLLPKKLRNLLFLNNWRLISLLNVDCKILTKLFAARLKDIMLDLIHPDQCGFVKDRHLSNGILDLYAIFDLVADQEEDFLICSIDVQKAFDSLDWSFLKYVLDKFGFLPHVVKWFDVFYNDKTAYVENNLQRSSPIHIQKGNFQSCPLSPLFLVLAIEILAIRIRNNPEIEGIKSDHMVKKLNLVADDLLLIFKNTYSGCDQVDQELKEFSSNSGLKVNKDKCTVTRLSPENQQLNQELLPLFQRNQGKFTFHLRKKTCGT